MYTYIYICMYIYSSIGSTAQNDLFTLDTEGSRDRRLVFSQRARLSTCLDLQSTSKLQLPCSNLLEPTQFFIGVDPLRLLHNELSLARSVAHGVWQCPWTPTTCFSFLDRAFLKRVKEGSGVPGGGFHTRNGNDGFEQMTS